MARRPVRWLVLWFAVAWFGVLVPVHNRGQIAVPGTEPAAFSGAACHADHAAAAPAAQAAHSCHSARPAGCDRHDAPDQGPAPKRGGSCAVCFFLAGLDAPPPVTTVEHLFGLVGEADFAEPASPVVAAPVLPFNSRGPPTA